MPNPRHEPDVGLSPADEGRGRVVLARKWAYLLSGVVIVPLTSDELNEQLRKQLDVLCHVLRDEPLSTEPARRIGSWLAELGYVGEEGLRCTLNVLGKGLLALPELQPRERFAERVITVLGELACGFLGANQRAVLEQQEGMQQALLKAVRDAQSHLNSSKARFEQVTTELTLLQGELSRQTLHDALTGLPNQQFLTSHLETALRRADPVHGISLLHLDIDGFGVVCSGLGRRVCERLLVHVGQRLRVVLADERTMIARLGGDEFAILVENSDTTPGIAAIMASINAELAEPVYVDGHGLAVSMSAGVVHQPPAEMPPEELLRAADAALRRAKTGRRGQWELFHPDQETHDRQTHALAAGMPGAWENGEIQVRYRPVADLSSKRTTALDAVLHWNRPGADPVPHEHCVELAQHTGLILPLGEWLIRIASGQAEWWRQRNGFDLPLAVELTAHQASDADLVSRIVRLLDETGLPPGNLMLSMPAGVLPAAEVIDNVTVLADVGVHTSVGDFSFAPDHLAALEELPVRSVRVARTLTARQGRSELACLSALAPLARRAGVTIAVDGINTIEQADWWRAAGANMGTGDLFGTALAPGDAVEHFEPDA